MSKKECIAMLLAGGQGSRLGALTKDVAKPAVSFGGKYRIIDFALSNCANSDINTVGVLTQYRPYLLHSYLGTGDAWNLNESGGGVSILPPYATQAGGAWYAGTADAVTQNIGFIEQNDPEYVLILSGDQLYSMDYQKMLENHKRHNADLTVAVMPVPWEEASRFGIITQDDDERILKFTEKPNKPDSNLASMGIYVFNTQLLVDTLRADAIDQTSEHDFGNDIIPKLLADGKRLYTYEYNGFWRDVGTISSYHETSMDLLGTNPDFDLFDTRVPIMSNVSTRPPAYVGPDGSIEDCLVGNGADIFGRAKHSVISTDAYIGERAVVEDSVLLPGAYVKAGAHVVRAILGENAVVEDDVVLGSVDQTRDTAVIGNNVVVGKGEE
ncbi:glucose-1-phosphate adenylyltransferase [Olsenella profusa DSM 13989]|uniref:glucose-1-phosphate adenylyltransferase n=1 Tax=Olsenella profusa TaxID=138595 RepID=UPI00278B3452|nr:glucose-1-phosphate adenylyltransferase [Olsenella profusa]MDP9858891.1 glucose-1-phosphate adenylyltransferase [Olsenella profusa DSM 13989]